MSIGATMHRTDSTIEKIKILVADDHEMILDIARMYLADQHDMSVQTATTLEQAIYVFQSEGPFDIVLLDYVMPGMSGLEGLKQMITVASPAPVAIITGNPTRSLMNEALDAGASGLLSKTTPVKSLANSIRFIHSGETYMPLHLMKDDLTQSAEKRGPLSAREMTVLEFLGEGKKNKDIANTLGLSEGTVKMHVMAICKKLDASNRTHAVIVARDSGLI